ncbi:ubiquitin carboxyl-terminal hydrolase 34-like protein, partial [Leptotrombidium deliense]
IPDKDLRIPSNRNMFEFMWSVIKDPLDPRCVIDKEGLALALKYFTSSTLTMRLAGIAQINNYISLFNEFCQTEGGITPRQADGEELVDWILSNKIIEHIFGPNLHVEVIKQSHIVLNFIVSHITAEHIDVIWSASQLKHCSRQVLDILTPLIKNMSVPTVLHLYALIRKMEPKDHTEQTLILGSCLLRFIWTKSLNIPEPSSLKGICNPLEELAIVKSPIFTMLPGSSTLRRHDANNSSSSASVDASDEDDDDDFDIVSQKLLTEQQLDSQSASSCGTQSSSDEAHDSKNNGSLPVIRVTNCKMGMKKDEKNFGIRQKFGRKNEGAASDSDDDKSYPRSNIFRKRHKSKMKNDANQEKMINRTSDDEESGSANVSANPGLNEVSCNTERDDVMSDSNSNSSQVSQTSQKNMADFDGEESGSGCETELVQLSGQSIQQKNSAAHQLANIACIHSQSYRSQLSKTKDIEKFDVELSKFNVDNVCKPGQTLLWDLLQDNSIGQLAEGLAHECEKILCNLICWLADRRIRMKFIEGCLENLSQNTSVIISLRLLPKLLMSFQQYRGGMDTHSITLWADNDRQMLKHFFSNLILYSEKKTHTANELHTHLEETQTRLHFLSFVFSFPGSPETFRLNRQQVDTLWSCIATDLDCRDELFNWMLNQVRIRDQHALDNEMLHYILMEKMPQLNPDNFSMLALELLHNLCGVALSNNSTNEVVSVAIKQLWDIALKAINTDVSMAAIKHLNNHYIHLQHPSSSLEKEEEFIKQCMDYLQSSLDSVRECEEKNLTVIQRALILLKTHLEAFRCRYSFHLRLLQLNGDISIVSHLNKSCERSGQQTIKIICQPAALNERTTFEMNSNDFVGELRAEVSFWWKQLAKR